MRRLSDKMLQRLIWLLLALALYFVGVAFYIPAKSVLSQNLLSPNWADTLTRLPGGSERYVLNAGAISEPSESTLPL